MKKEADYKKRHQKWWFMGGVGAVFLGTGLSGAIESGFLKYSGAVWYEWFIAGTISLSLFIIGLDILFRANRLKIKLGQEKSNL